MINSFHSLVIPVALTLSAFALPQNAPNVKDYFGFAGPISFNQKKFSLTWSSHPTAVYYKQEYLFPTEKPETYHQMIMIEALNAEVNLEETVRGKINELNQRKSTDAIVQYQVSENKAKDEYLLDFVIGGSSASGEIAEWNIYRYCRLKLKSGKTGILLFAYSKRAYNKEITNFLMNLKTERLKYLTDFEFLKVPSINITK